MKVNKQNENTSMTPGQMRRLERKKEAEKAKRMARISKIVSYSILALIILTIGGTIGYSVYRNVTRIKPSSDFSTYLTDEGLIKDVTATDLVDLVDYKNITAPLSEIEYSDESVEADIQELIESKKVLNKETDAAIKEGDIINLDYVGTVDGEEFTGGNSEGKGEDLKIGSNSFIDDFETQLIGHKIGDEVTVNVTFPKDYKENSLAGKDAVFEVVINGIYDVPEFTDDFVKENVSDKASTTEEYRKYLKDTNYDKNLETWLKNYLDSKTTVKSYPENYLNQLMRNQKYQDQQGLEYMKSLYASFGSNQNITFEDYVQMSESKYDKTLKDTVKPTAKTALLYQAIYELEKDNITVSKDDYSTYFTDDTNGGYDAEVAEKGTGYVMQQILQNKVLDYVKGFVTVE